jgi:hypothetical protein
VKRGAQHRLRLRIGPIKQLRRQEISNVFGRLPTALTPSSNSASAATRGPSLDKPQSPEPSPEPQFKSDKIGEAGKQSQAKTPSLGARLRERWGLATAGAFVLPIASIGGVAHWLNIRHYESTDDAFIAARSFSVAPKVGAYVTDVLATDNQHVNASDLLPQIDDSDYRKRRNGSGFLTSEYRKGK